LRVGLVSPLQQVNPRVAPDFGNLVLQPHIYESAYRPSPDGKALEPVLLELPLRSEDAQRRSYSAAVLPGRRFSDGTPLTPERVATSFSATPALRDVLHTSVRAGRVLFELARPHAHPERLLASRLNTVCHERDGRFLGTGPYVLETDRGGLAGRLLRNPHYDGPLRLDEIALQVFPPDERGARTALIEALKQGTIDFTDALSKSDLDGVPGVRKLIELGHTTGTLFFNTEQAPLDDVRVRQALALAIDRHALAAASWTNPLAFAATGLLPPRLGSFPDGLVHDPARARALLREAGLLPGQVRLRLLSIPLPRPHLPRPGDVARALAAGFENVGVAVEWSPVHDLEQFVSRAHAGAYDLLLSGWIPDSQDPVEFLEAHLGSQFVPGRELHLGRANNLARLRRPALDAALQNARQEGSAASLLRVHELLHEERPLVPLMYGPWVAALSWRVTRRPAGFVLRPFFHELELAD
jgi:ABC-type transport system substrate-binding protein